MRCEYCNKEHDRKRFCSTTCKDDWHKAVKRANNHKKHLENLATCYYCCVSYVPFREDQVFCSNKCKIDKHAKDQREARKLARAQVVKICPICNKEFSPSFSMREIYCSKKCRECIGKKIYKMMQSCYDDTETAKADRSHKVLGYSPFQLLEHLQKFPDWEQLKHGSWHLDHIFPICAFAKKGIKDAAMICSLDNLQPLPGSKNCSKGGKYDEAAFALWLNNQSIVLV